VGEAENKIMILKLSQGKKIFLTGAIITLIVLCAYSVFSFLEKEDKSALASPTVKKSVNVVIKGKADCQVGQKYSVSWDSECRGGEVNVWLATASTSKSNIGILVPLTNFSAADFGEKGDDSRIFFDDCWKFNLSHNANKGKINFIMPSALNLPKKFFKSDQGVFYAYIIPDGRFALHKIVKEPVMMQVMPGNYYLRVDIKGKNGCVATGFSQKLKIRSSEDLSAAGKKN
jgi:hypothetical protein